MFSICTTVIILGLIVQKFDELVFKVVPKRTFFVCVHKIDSRMVVVWLSPFFCLCRTILMEEVGH